MRWSITQLSEGTGARARTTVAGSTWGQGSDAILRRRMLVGPARPSGPTSVGLPCRVTSLPAYLLRGTVAGTVGTPALNARTCVDMALRARPASSTPAEVVKRSAAVLGTQLSRDPGAQTARASGLGLLLGTAAGVSGGASLGALRAPPGSQVGPPP